ncbi:LLM class flavin-dependent oxidoreductase [Chryseobacterium candidae]|uniref:LLM class flavin-dependent oxidoreductase n=1 Tax=Chryseobacterium candidae TaxID=1978493 RepID=A0ABY2RCN5_9FLAO|nr:LLM class flavin-dependent oxidoreductase [Chryseobacterium candidae]THV62248.1 LLM class flavin-dependent oxidoreductase [Chryseobacterium candidae]
MIKLGVLDFGRRGDLNSLEIIEQIITYASQAEEFGFNRFWLGEHHLPIPNVSYTNPEIIISLVAGMTESILVGSAGSLISMHSPYTVATNFRLLNNIYYKRIELGLAKGAPESVKVMELTNDKLLTIPQNEIFEEKLNAILGLFNNDEYNLKENKLVIPPYGGVNPEIWYLSSDFKYLDLAIAKNLNYCVSTFHGAGKKLSATKDKLNDFKTVFSEKNGREVKIVLSIAFCTDNSQALQDQNPNQHPSESFNILNITIENLSHIIEEYHDEYGVDEFVLYDTSATNETKILNLKKLNTIFYSDEK